MRTTEKKRSLSTVVLPWKKHEFSIFPMRPEGKYRSTETTNHRSTLITRQSQMQEQKMLSILVISEQMSLVFSEIQKDKHVLWMDELYTYLKSSQK